MIFYTNNEFLEEIREQKPSSLILLYLLLIYCTFPGPFPATHFTWIKCWKNPMLSWRIWLLSYVLEKGGLMISDIKGLPNPEKCLAKADSHALTVNLFPHFILLEVCVRTWVSLSMAFLHTYNFMPSS